MNDLKDLFEHQRRVESARIPSFASSLARAQLNARRTVARRGLWLYGTASAAAIVVLTLVTWNAWRGSPPALEWTAPLGVELTSVSWNSPTDFLLNTPDAQALSGMPRLAPLARLRDLTPTPPAPANDTND